ncbi:MAG: hypothetical protein AAGA58_13120 [Verrucomicrobiota bacterium]
MGTKLGIFRRVVVLSVGISAWALVTSLHAAEGYREFVNKKGAKLEAKLIGSDATQAQIQRKDGKKFVIPIESLSDADQSHIKEWAKKNPKLGIKEDINYSFRMNAEKKRLDKQERIQAGDTYTFETWVYNLEVLNNARVDLKDVTIEYISFVRDVDSETVKSKAPLVPTYGKHEFEAIPQGGSVEITTKEFQLVGFEIQRGYRFTGKANERYEDAHGGLWVKVFHQGDEVDEYRYADSAFKDLDWEKAKGKVNPDAD